MFDLIIQVHALLLHVHIGENSGKTYHVNCQCFYRSQACLSITNAVEKATLSLEAKEQRFRHWWEWKDDGIIEKELHWAFFRWCFCWCTSSASLAVLLHACAWADRYSQCIYTRVWNIGWGWANVAASCNVTTIIMVNLMYCWCWQQFQDFPYLAAMSGDLPNSGDC